MAGRLQTLAMSLERQEQNLAHLNPQSILERGYSIAYSADGTLLTDSARTSVGDTVRIVFAKGWSRATVVDKAGE